jgi:hypothetical protein
VKRRQGENAGDDREAHEERRFLISALEQLLVYFSEYDACQNRGVLQDISIIRKGDAGSEGCRSGSCQVPTCEEVPNFG